MLPVDFLYTFIQPTSDSAEQAQRNKDNKLIKLIFLFHARLLLETLHKSSLH